MFSSDHVIPQTLRAALEARPIQNAVRVRTGEKPQFGKRSMERLLLKQHAIDFAIEDFCDQQETDGRTLGARHYRCRR
jgi:hypothetical protein